MPRRKRVKCPIVGNGPALNAVVEWNLTEWLGPTVSLDPFNYEELEVAWSQHRDELLKEWISQLPGSRPFASYATGETPLPAKVMPGYPNEEPFVSRDGPIVNYVCYFPTQYDEYQHLLGLDVMSDDEKARAQCRFKDDGDWDHYQSLFVSRETSAVS